MLHITVKENSHMKKRIIKFITLSLTAYACSLIAMNSCKATDVSGSSLEVSNETSVESTVKASKPSIKGKMTVAKGKTKKLKLKNVSGLKIKWRTKNKSIAKVVMKKGVPYVKACKVGKTVIRAKADGKTLKCRVIVKKKAEASKKKAATKKKAAATKTKNSNNSNKKNTKSSSTTNKSKSSSSTKNKTAISAMLEGMDVSDGKLQSDKQATKGMTEEEKEWFANIKTN